GALYHDRGLAENAGLARPLEARLRIGRRPLKLHGLAPDAAARMPQGPSRRGTPPGPGRMTCTGAPGTSDCAQGGRAPVPGAAETKIFGDSGQCCAERSVDEVDVPDGVGWGLGRRVGRLREPVKQVLTAAAVIGRSFSFPLLAALLEQPDEDGLLTALDEAQRIGLLVSSAERPEAPFTFAHELVRQTLLAGLSLPRPQRLHLQVAEAIERVHAGMVHERASELAHHLLKAGSLADTPKVVQYLTVAGQRALEAAAYEDALRQFQSALAHGDALDARQ